MDWVSKITFPEAESAKSGYQAIFAFNGTILAAFALCCLILTWLSLELFIHHQRTKTHW